MRLERRDAGAFAEQQVPVVVEAVTRRELGVGFTSLSLSPRPSCALC
jgi:hypothetical protein